jgi:methanogenic corrinoid protein MtbC1
MSEILSQLAEGLYNGDASQVAELVKKALDEGIEPNVILGQGLVVGMDRVGVDFRDGELFVPEVLVCARAMHAGMDVLRPLLADGDSSFAGKAVVGTVAGDLHDIGKNLVVMMLEGAGFRAVDAGIDVASQKFVAIVQKERPNLLGMSALLTTTMTSMQATMDALVEAGLRDTVKMF